MKCNVYIGHALKIYNSEFAGLKICQEAQELFCYFITFKTQCMFYISCVAPLPLLHFALVVDDVKCILVTFVCVCVCVCVCLFVCLSLAACPHYCTDLDVTWGNGRGCPLVVHCWVDLQSVHVLRCYDNIARTRNVSEWLFSLYAWLF